LLFAAALASAVVAFEFRFLLFAAALASLPPLLFFLFIIPVVQIVRSKDRKRVYSTQVPYMLARIDKWWQGQRDDGKWQYGH
jgi:ABC-type transport system involved in cytochrome bd biosynthesis fused ATPase/permease subunit